MISVIVIGKNEEAHLPSCLESIHRAMRTMSHELIYVDSGSTDASREIAENLGAKVYVLEETSPTPGLGRRVGTEVARGEWLLFLDGDMQLQPGFVEKALMASVHGTGALTGIREDRYLKDGKLVETVPNYYGCTQARICPEFGGALMIRRDVLLDAGGWSSDTRALEEDELHARLRARNVEVLELPVPMILNTDESRDNRTLLSTLFSRRRLGEGEVVRCAAANHALGAYISFRKLRFAFFLSDLLCALAFVLSPVAGLLTFCAVQSCQMGYHLSRKTFRGYFTQKLFFFYLPAGLVTYRRRKTTYFPK